MSGGKEEACAVLGIVGDPPDENRFLKLSAAFYRQELHVLVRTTVSSS